MPRNSIRLALAVLPCLVAVIPGAVRAQPVIEIVETTINRPHATAGDGVIVMVKIKNVGTTVANNVSAGVNGSDHFDFFPPRCWSGPLDHGSCHFGDLKPGQVTAAKFAAEVTAFVKGETREAWLVVDVYTADVWTARADFPVWIVGKHQ